jgi:hypothetical protein
MWASSKTQSGARGWEVAAHCSQSLIRIGSTWQNHAEGLRCSVTHSLQPNHYMVKQQSRIRFVSSSYTTCRAVVMDRAKRFEHRECVFSHCDSATGLDSLDTLADALNGGDDLDCLCFDACERLFEQQPTVERKTQRPISIKTSPRHSSFDHDDR